MFTISGLSGVGSIDILSRMTPSSSRSWIVIMSSVIGGIDSSILRSMGAPYR